MSTKTKLVFKRIALVTISALGLTLLSGPASKAAYDSTNATPLTTISVSAVGRVGVGIEVLAWSQNPPAQYACGTDCYLHMRLTGAPTAAGTVNTALPFQNGGVTANLALVQDSVSVTRFTGAGWARAYLTSDSQFDTYAAGTYTFQYWVDTQSDNRTALSLHPTAKTGTVSVTLRGAPTQVTLAATTGTSDSSSLATNLVTATFKDVDGNETLLTGSETYTITTGSSVASSYLAPRIGDTLTSSGFLTTSSDSRTSTGRFVAPYYAQTAINGGIALGFQSSSNGNSSNGRQLDPLNSGNVRFYVGASATSATFAVKGIDGLSGVNSSNFTLTNSNPATIEVVVPTTTYVDKGYIPDTSSATLGVRDSSFASPSSIQAGNASAAPTDIDLYASTVTGKTLYFAVKVAAATGLVKATIAKQTNVPLPTGVTAGALDYTVDTTWTYITVTATAPTNGDAYELCFNMTAGTSACYNVVYKSPQVASSIGSVVTNIDTTPKAAVGSTNTVTFVVRDGFGSLVSGATVKMTHDRTASGATSDLLSTTTDASGNASLSFTDVKTTAASGATTLNSAGTLVYYVQTANASSNNTGTRYINYTSTAFVTPGVLTATGDEVTDAQVAAGATANLIDATKNETITVTTDTGAVMAGIAYTATLSSGLYERKTTYASGNSQLTGFTNASGQAFIRVRCYKSGAQSVTWTVGSLTKVVSLTCVSSSGSLRSIAVDSATKSVDVDATGVVTVTASDIYGNIVPGVSLTVTYTGANGRIVSYNGAQGGSATTDTAGKLAIGVYAEKAGTGTLRITATNVGVLATTTTTGQGVAPIARVDDVSVAVTSAGLSSTEKAVANAQAAADAATDAALQAIDAANAATDAANLSAEAADAATVAAQEAKDSADAATAAVESLATQVATLMAALQAQITSLANVVAKIAKKVKA